MLQPEDHHCSELDEGACDKIRLAFRPKQGDVVRDKPIDELEKARYRCESLDGLHPARFHPKVGLEEVRRSQKD